MSNTQEISFTHRSDDINVNQIRRQGDVPGILYGSHKKNVMVKISRRRLMEEVSSEGWHSLKNIDIDGEKYTAIIKEIQTDSLTHKIIHIDLETVKPTEMVTTELPVRFLQNKNVSKSGAILQKEKDTVKVRCSAQNVPEFLKVTINPQITTVYRIANIEASEEITFVDDPKTVLASLQSGSYAAQEDEPDDEKNM
ncbi:50S ribosomal protein L25 [Clostridium oryzae]|uniref:General stress protein CTC n=1 Tax=Clostridium oryzae TaxID=1450648 RepID=A0A1V4ICY9_9CLOT|nr:50S ribosomal protein L25 [Clostridium oryzae]OPJ57505.1 general stress protein CTC [Clostridium oryzae]